VTKITKLQNKTIQHTVKTLVTKSVVTSLGWLSLVWLQRW